MSKEQTIAVCFCGAAKTTSLGIPLVTAMWTQADDLTRAFITIPVLLYTIEQVSAEELFLQIYPHYCYTIFTDQSAWGKGVYSANFGILFQVVLTTRSKVR
jgi:hypothetical protein